jgi:hypothetical protein
MKERLALSASSRIQIQVQWSDDTKPSQNAKVNAKPNTKSKRVLDNEFAKSKRLKTALDNQILYREYYLERAELRRRLIFENSLALAIIWDKYNFA